MKKIYYTLLVSLLFITACQAQQIDKITRHCMPPNPSSYAAALVTLAGDITYIPCPSRTSIFTGNVDFSGATVTGLPVGNGDVLAGANHTTNFVPFWSNGAQKTISDSPFSWNGTLYNFQNTALNNTFQLQFTPSSTVGLFSVGTGGNLFSLTQSTGIGSLASVGNLNLTSGAVLNLQSGFAARASFGTGVVNLGDTASQQNNTTISINDNLQSIFLSGHGSQNNFSAVGGIITLGGTHSSIMLDDTGTGETHINTGSQDSAADFNAGAKQTTIGDLNNQIAIIEIDGDPVNGLDMFGTNIQIGNGGAGETRINSRTLKYNQRTLTPAGTTGAQTINLSVGSVNFAAGASTLVVTDSIAIATSLIYLTPQTNDATCKSFSITRAAGSFTITSNAACTAETAVAFIVYN